MAWYETVRAGHRVRFVVPGKRAAGAGPVFPTREGAREWAVQHGYDRADIDTVAELLQRWVDVKTAEKRLFPSYILEVETKILALATERKWLRWSDITMPAIDQWKIASDGVNVSKRLACLLSLLRWGHRQYGLPIDTVVLRHPTVKPRRRAVSDVLLTDHQVGELLEAATAKGPSVVALIHYLATYGPRPITACTRLIRHVNFTAGTMTVDGKRSGQWVHALRQDTLSYFAAAAKDRDDDQPLFLDPRTEKGWAIDDRHAATALCDWYLRHLGKKIAGEALQGIYHLKRYAITRMLAAGIDPPTVAKFTGHLSLSQVMQYARANQRTTKEALELLCVSKTHTTHTPGPSGHDISLVVTKGRRG